MPMREECKHFQSRTYATGEVVRFCELDLAPEAPWRCPDDCASYDRRLADVAGCTGAWSSPPSRTSPVPVGPTSSELLEEAEDIVDAVVPRDAGRGATRRARQRERQGSRPPVVAPPHAEAGRRPRAALVNGAVIIGL